MPFQRGSGISLRIARKRGYRVKTQMKFDILQQYKRTHFVGLIEVHNERKNMVKHCIAFGCSNRSSKPECRELSWHLLPLSNKKLLTEWLVKLRRANTPVTKNSYVCSQHFVPDCFKKSLGGQRSRLKPGSVPTKFIFTVDRPERKKTCFRGTYTNIAAAKRTARADFDLMNTEAEEPSSNTASVVENEDVSEEHVIIETDVSVKSLDNENEQLKRQLKLKEDEILRLQERLRQNDCEHNTKMTELTMKLDKESKAKVELEISNRQKVFNIATVKDNNKLFRFYTGFENYEMFSMVLDFLGREAASHLDYINSKISSPDPRNHNVNKPGPSRALSVENEFFMVLCRLKVGLLEDDLAVRFGICQSVVSQVINTWIRFMFFRFKELDVFPSKEIVKLHMPECFIKKYSSTTIIIDATEIYIEKPNNPEAQQLTFSSYKNANTLKALIGIVPKGAISFVSTLFGGSISDKELTQKSGLVDKLQHGDCIMADRGFNIQEMLASKGVKVNVPPFMNPTGQFEENELLETRRIATLRIHVERAMERIKNYHILDFVPITLCSNGLIDMIFFVCAMLSNFQPPLVNG